MTGQSNRLTGGQVISRILRSYGMTRTLSTSFWNNTAFQDPIRPIEYFSCLRINAFFCKPDMIDDIKASSGEMDRAKREVLLQNIMARLHDLARPFGSPMRFIPRPICPRLSNFVMRPTGIIFEELR